MKETKLLFVIWLTNIKSLFLLKSLTACHMLKVKKPSIQVAARNLRYEWFKTFIGNGVDQYKFLLTGHHLDDNIETMLMYFFRGTGISGLTGMPEKNGHLVRPLLKISRKQLKEFALGAKPGMG